MTTITSVKESVVEILEVLPPEKQQELLNFARLLKMANIVKRPRKSLKGMWADLDIHITEEDIKEVRSEMWGNLDEKFADL
jgi:hypothetical protein